MSVEFGPWWWPFDEKKRPQCDVRLPQCDFYTSVNWKWEQESKIPEDSGQVSSWTEAEDELLQDLVRACKASPRLRTVWEAAIDRPSTTPGPKKFKKFQETQEWAKRIAKLHMSGIEAFFEFDVRSDIYNDAHERVFFAKQGGISLPDKGMFEMHGDALREHMRHTFEACGFDPSLSDIAYGVERRLAASHLTTAQRRGPGTFRKMAVSELPGGFAWADYLEALGIGHASHVFVEHVEALEAAIVEMSDEKAADAYIAWLWCRWCARECGGTAHRLHWAFYGGIVMGAKAEKSPERRAVEDIGDLFPEELALAYIELDPVLHSRNREQARHVVDAIRGSMRRLMEHSQLLGAESRKECLTKIDTMLPVVGFPNAWPPHTRLVLDAALRKKTWPSMCMAARTRRAQLNLKDVGTPAKRGEWTDMFPHSMNACFNPVENTIVLPAALLASRVFNLETPEAAAASAGMIVSHEMSHGFDDIGRRFSSKGTWGRWWPARDTEEYARRCALLDAQLKEAGLDPELARGEAIADLVGMRVALDSLPPHANLAIFFETWARMWRVKFTPSHKALMQRIDPHATGWARTVLPLRNFQEFHSWYKITDQDGMWLSPEKRVSVF